MRHQPHISSRTKVGTNVLSVLVVAITTIVRKQQLLTTTKRRTFNYNHNYGLQKICLQILCLFLIITTPTTNATNDHKDNANTNTNDFKPFIKLQSDANLFALAPEIRVHAPTYFPKPTRKINDTSVPIVEPAFGRHRSNADVIMAYAEGYRLPYYMMFIETLAATGYTGDVVLAIAEPRIIKPDVVDYLRTYAVQDEQQEQDTFTTNKPNVIVYQTPLDCEGRDGSIENLRIVSSKSGQTDIFQMCKLSGVYGWKDPSTGQITGTANDPREGRVVATLRYEWYWIWTLRYNPHSWIMLLDARDSYFQVNPFNDLPRTKNSNSNDNNIADGLLYFFGENADATRLGKSTKNMKWIQTGYGEKVLNAVKDKPTICSGSTMGEQIAIETYLRAMVNEHDESQTRMTGSDQGFHNYLYYSGKLTSAKTIRKIIVWEQGRGIINNLGALRIKKLSEWGIHDNKTQLVYQWDGVSLSPVCHQFDRDKSLHSYIVGKKHKAWEEEWYQSKYNKEKQENR